MKYRKKSIAVTWLISYIIILLIPLTVNIFIFLRTQNLVADEINRANSGLLQEIRRCMDSILTDVEGLTTDIVFNSRLKGLPLQKEAFDTGDYHQLLLLSNDLKIYQNSKQTITDFYLYFRKQDVVVTPTFFESSYTFYNLTQKDKFQSYSEWKEMAENKFYGEYIPIKEQKDDGSFSNTISYYRTLPNNDEKGSLVIEIDNTALEQQLQSIQSVQQGDFYILDKYSRTLYSSNDTKLKFKLSYSDFPQKQGVLTQTIDSEKTSVSYVSSEKNDWIYIYTLPQRIFMEKLSYLYQLTGISMILCLLVGGAVIVMLVKRNYHPVSQLIDRLGVNESEEGNEYNRIEQAILETLSEQSRIKRQLHQQKDIIKRNYLASLMKGVADTKRVTPKEFLAQYDIHLQSDYFAVMLFFVEDESEFLEDDPAIDMAQRHQLLQFTLTNISEEIISKKFIGLATEADSMMACLVCLPEPCPVEDLKQAARQIQSTLKSYFDLQISITLGQTHQTAPGIHLSYNEAMEALQYLTVIGTQELIYYGDIPSHDASSYYYPMDLEQQFLNRIKSGDAEGAKSILETVFDANMQQGAMSAEMAKCLMFDFICTMMKSMGELGNLFGRDYIETHDYVNRLMGCDSIYDMKRELGGILDEVCADIAGQDSPKSTPLVSQVKDYIMKNYQNPALTVAEIAGLFHMTGAYITRLFREQTGQTIVEYISGYRMERVRELLSSPDGRYLSVEQLSALAGYDSARTFTRHFKKHFGVSPGKYKETL